MKTKILGWMLIVACVCCLSGCDQKRVYTGSVKIVRVDGEVSRIDVELPGQTVSLKDREDANKLIAHLEALTTELKAGRDQFKVQEPVAPNPSGK